MRTLATKKAMHVTRQRIPLPSEETVVNHGQELIGVDVLQRQPVCACDGGCPRCALFQTKLKVSAPDDRYEREADEISSQVMRMPVTGMQLKPT